MSGNDYCFYLWQLTKVRTGAPRFYRRDELPNYGFSSIYAVREEDAKAIIACGSQKGFKGFVWSRILWIDVDSEERGLEAGRRLIKAGYEVSIYYSGSKGFHIGLTRDAEPSPLLPSMDKEWVRKNIPEADLSIYTHLHLFRCPGARHEKTGKRKRLIESHRGKPVSVQEFKEPVSRRVVEFDRVRKITSSIFDDHRVMINSVPTLNGRRHPQLVRCAYALRDRGEDPQFAFRWLQHVNQLFEEPKDEKEIERIINDVYECKH